MKFPCLVAGYATSFSHLAMNSPNGTFSNWLLYGLFGWRGEGGGVKESRVELARNKLILC